MEIRKMRAILLLLRQPTTNTQHGKIADKINNVLF
jgi:hypothetical protein